MSDMNKPDNTSLNVQHLQEATNRSVMLGKMQRPTANTPVGYVSWNDSISSFEKWDGVNWLKLDQKDFSLTGTGILNLNTLFSAGNYSVQAGATGSPLNGSGSVIVSGDGSSAGITFQAISDSSELLIRERRNNAWGAWRTMTSKQYVDDGLALKTSIRGDGTKELRFSYPDGGTFRGIASNVGAIKVSLPVGFTSKMMTIKIAVFDNSIGESFEIVLAGYTNSTGSWQNPTAYTIGDPNADRVFDVRYGESGGKACIYIGDLGSAWSYLSVTVTDLIIGFTTGNYSAWSNGWSISLETIAFENVTATVLAEQVGRTIGRNLILHDGMDSGWLVPTMINGWVDYGAGYSTLKYRKSASGTVYIQGVIKNNGGVTPPYYQVCTLPLGYAPAQNVITVQKGSPGNLLDTSIRVDVNQLGQVIVNTMLSSSTWLTINIYYQEASYV